nr:sulfatase [Crateriforma spongiae]
MNTRFAFLSACWFVGALCLNNSMADPPTPRPNVVLILVDDLGWQDVGCYDIDDPCPYETPNIDRLADRGVQFWQAYSPAPTCAPSRAAILSGRHPARLQKTHVVGGAPPSPHTKNSPLISPWYSGRMRLSEITIAEALQSAGYVTGHVGKWHVAINHNSFPQPEDQGFEYTRSDRGVTRPQRPNRLTDFATDDPDDPYRLDKNGFPYHQNSVDAIEFIDQAKDRPFFLYQANWLVHAPIHTRAQHLLEKYCRKMKVPYPTDPTVWDVQGQNNPYYAAMVEMLDYYVGKTVNHLSAIDDPRRPGHKLIENTYIIFTSDNGGMERHPGEVITDNYPLDKGKINAKEGGVRVPLIICGPGIAAGTQTQAMVNGLDFYPTILSWTGVDRPESQHLDGSDLSRFLTLNPPDPDAIKGADGQPRDRMFWHFPHSSMQSTMRVGGYKLIRNWEPYLQGQSDCLELYRLYDDQGHRVDIEESENLAIRLPEIAEDLHQQLDQLLEQHDADAPMLNAKSARKLPNRQQVPTPLRHGRKDQQVWATFRENGAKVVHADLIYTDNGGHRDEEWYRIAANIVGNRVVAALPASATHYVFNLIDENHFLVSYPDVKYASDASGNFSDTAFARDAP